MFRIVALVLLLLGAQFSATVFAPAATGKAWLLWPFANDSKSWLGVVGGLPKQSGSVVTPLPQSLGRNHMWIKEWKA